jgi:hypothetical protein
MVADMLKLLLKLWFLAAMMPVEKFHKIFSFGGLKRSSWMFLEELVVPVRTKRMFYFLFFNKIFINYDGNFKMKIAGC